MLELYPPIQPYETGMLDVGDGNRIYWEASGNPHGKPAVVLHGGPGAGTSPVQRRHFDPSAYRIVLFDQRGSGQSTPHVRDQDVDMSVNTTWHLVADMERLREHLGIRRWQIFGGSWGATLALAYAQTHPERVTEIILRGVFTLRRTELDWLYGGGAANLFPEAWEGFLAPIPVEERDDLLGAYHRRVHDPDPEIRIRAATAWSAWEGATVSLLPDPSMTAQYNHPSFAVPFARIALHYFVRNGWLDDGQLIRDAHRIAGIPGVIVQGRYDAVCPPATAWELHRAWPGSELVLLPNAGHAVADPGVLRGLADATERFKNT